MTTSAGRPLAVKVAAIVDPKAQVTSDVTISQAAFDAHFPRPSDLFVFVHTPNGTNAATTASIDRVVGRFTEVDAHTKADWVDFRGADMRKFLMLLYVLLALSVIVSLFGMVNALVLTVFERTREIGMMRAVGMTRRQVRRMVRHESIITALIGAGLGLPLGLVVAAAMAGALQSPFVIPFAPTCSRNHAAGTLPSMITRSGTCVRTASGSSERSRFLKILPAHFMEGGYLRFRTVRMSVACLVSSSASPGSRWSTTE